MVKIGPDHTFHRGEPQFPHDRGGLYTTFAINRPLRMGVMQFGATVDWLSSTRVEALKMAVTLRRAIEGAFGELAYRVEELPIRVIANREKQLVEIYLPHAVAVLAANPEVWLALAERLDAEAQKLD